MVAWGIKSDKQAIGNFKHKKKPLWGACLILGTNTARRRLIMRPGETALEWKF